MMRRTLVGSLCGCRPRHPHGRQHMLAHTAQRAHTLPSASLCDSSHDTSNRTLRICTSTAQGGACLVSHACRSWLRRGSAAIACTSCRTSCRAPRPRHPGGRWTARQVSLINITVGGTRRCLLSGWTGAGLRVPMERTAAPVVSADRPRVRRHDCTAGKSELCTVVVGHVPSLITTKSALLLMSIAFRRHYCTAAVWTLPRRLLPAPLCRGASWASWGLVVYP